MGSGLWRAKSFSSSGPKLPFKRLKPLKPLKRSDTCQWLCHTSGFWTLQTLHGCFRRSKTSHLLCGLWALRESDAPKPRTCQTVGSGLCEPVGGVAQIVGSELWRAKYFFLVARNCPSHVSNLSNPSIPSNPSTNCQWFCHTSGFWDASDAPKPRTCYTVGSGLCARLWGEVAQTVGSGLWRTDSFFSSGQKLPFNPHLLGCGTPFPFFSWSATASLGYFLPTVFCAFFFWSFTFPAVT